MKTDQFVILPPISPEYDDDLDPQLQEESEVKEAMGDIELFEQQLSVRRLGKQPVDENSIVLD